MAGHTAGNMQVCCCCAGGGVPRECTGLGDVTHNKWPGGTVADAASINGHEGEVGHDATLKTEHHEQHTRGSTTPYHLRCGIPPRESSLRSRSLRNPAAHTHGAYDGQRRVRAHLQEQAQGEYNRQAMLRAPVTSVDYKIVHLALGTT